MGLSADKPHAAALEAGCHLPRRASPNRSGGGFCGADIALAIHVGPGARLLCTDARAYSGPYPIRSHRTMEQVIADEAHNPLRQPPEGASAAVSMFSELHSSNQ